jgi:anti-anti-sigma regulatory factor
MQIDVSTQEGSVPVHVVQPHGDLDGSNYTQLIDFVRKRYQEGACDFVLDLSDVPFVSSAGLMAIHSVALMLRGEATPDIEAGWSALKSADQSRDMGLQVHVKLVGLQEGVADTLDKVGFTQFFAIFPNVPDAVASF